MLTIVLMIVLGAPPADLLPAPRAVPAATLSHSALRDALAQKLKAMSESDSGVFHEDVTAIAAPYFPVGQRFAETERVLAEQKLGPLRHFHGKGDSADTRMYVSHAELMSEMYSDVSIVLDFDFKRTDEREMILTKVTAFLKAASM